MNIMIIVLSTALTIWSFLTIVAILIIKALIKKEIIIIKFDSRKKADILIDELNEMIMEGKHE